MEHNISAFLSQASGCLNRRMALIYETKCSLCHKCTVSRTWGETVGSQVRCLACVPRINVCGQQYTLVKGAQPGKTFNGYKVHCPHHVEGCGWTGEVSQVENHLNPHPTADNLLDGCQFQTLNLKREHCIKIQQQHTKHLQELKVVILCVVLLFAVLITGSLITYKNSSDRLRVIKEVEIATNKSVNELRTFVQNKTRTQAQKLTAQQIIAEVMRKQVEEIRMNVSASEGKCKQMVKEVEEATSSHAKTLKKVIHDRFSYLHSQIESHVEILKSNGSALESKCKEMVSGIAETMSRATKQLEKLIQDKYDLLMNQVELLGDNISEVNSSQHAQRAFIDAMKHTVPSIVENNEWILDEILHLSQQVDFPVLPLYNMPLTKRQGNYMVSMPFYTEYQGYRMRIVVYPRNDSDRMVVCLFILQGKYDQIVQRPLNANFFVTLNVNEIDLVTKVISFPSDKNSIDCFSNLTSKQLMINEGLIASYTEYDIRGVQNVTLHLDIVKELGWWKFMIQFMVYTVQFVIQCVAYIWYIIVSIVIVACVLFFIYILPILNMVALVVIKFCDCIAHIARAFSRT